MLSSSAKSGSSALTRSMRSKTLRSTSVRWYMVLSLRASDHPHGLPYACGRPLATLRAEAVGIGFRCATKERPSDRPSRRRRDRRSPRHGHGIRCPRLACQIPRFPRARGETTGRSCVGMARRRGVGPGDGQAERVLRPCWDPPTGAYHELSDVPPHRPCRGHRPKQMLCFSWIRRAEGSAT